MPTMKFLRRCALAIAVAGVLLPAQGAQPVEKAAAQGPDLDLSIRYYTRIQTPEGVLRETRYEEKMVRRQGHVWVARVLPREAVHEHADEHAHASQGGMRRAVAQKEAAPHQHKHFNHVMLPRHVMLEGGRLRLEFVNFAEKEVVSITPSEYDNVNFDGSWTNAFHLVDPKAVAALPLAKRASPAAAARWHEAERNGTFQRVLWDEQKMIPLVLETGNDKGTFFQRIEVRPQAALAKTSPWEGVKGFVQKEYADFLD